MIIILPKKETVLVELSYEELKLLTKNKLYSQRVCEDFIREYKGGKDVPIADWLKIFQIANKDRDQQLITDIKSLLTFYENRVNALDRLYEFDEIKEME